MTRSRLPSLLLTAWCLLTLLPATRAGESYPLRPAKECSERHGLPNIASKLEAGQPVRVAYLGGSITAAAGWRVKTLAWLQREYPQADISEINAAIGGTGSDLGVYRLRHDVLRFKPDLLFVEFAVNDGGTDPAEIERCMEGIVRQTWAKDPTIDICYVYTLTSGMLPDLKAGRFPRAASAMENVADVYGIPSIHFGVEVAKQVNTDKLIFQAPANSSETGQQGIGDRMVFSRDGVHPLDAGHGIYAGVVAKHFDSLSAAGPADPHHLPAPLRPDNYEQAKLLRLDCFQLGDDWSRLDSTTNTLARRFGERVPGLYRATRPGTGLSFRFRGTAVGIYDLLGPDCGQLVVRLDGGPPRTVPRIDGYCTYHRLAFLQIANDLPDGLHTVDVRIDHTVPDKASILFPKNRKDLEANPTKYQGTAWYAGGILLIGKAESMETRE